MTRKRCSRRFDTGLFAQVIEIRSRSDATGAMLMRCCIRRLFSYSVLALIVAILLLPLSNAAYARSPNIGRYTIFDDIVGADPGEDPHLKVDPVVDDGIARDLLGRTSSSTIDGGESAIMGGHQATGRKVGAGRTRVKTKLLVTLKILFGQIFR